MKTSKLIILQLFLALLFNTSCIVKHDNGKHKGWFKGSKKSSSSTKSAGKSGNPGKGNKK